MSDKNDPEKEVAASESTRILELRKENLELAKKSRFFETLIRSLPGVFYVLDHNLHILNRNEKAEWVIGYSRDESGPGRRGHPVSGRGGRAETESSGEAFASHRGRRLFTGLEQPEQDVRFPHHRGHKPRPARPGQDGGDQGGLLLQDSYHPDRRASVACTQAGHPSPFSQNRVEAERAVIKKALDMCKGRKGMTAKALGISRRTLFRKMKQLQLS